MKKNLLGISTLTLVGLYALLSVVVLGACLIANIPLSYGILLSIIILILQFLLAPFFTDLSMKWFYKANFNAEIPIYLKDFIQNVCNKEGIKFPKFAVIDDGAPNAFTYGRFKNDARVVVSRGIFELLTEEEVKAVVGHEMGHIIHLDMFFMTVAQLVPLILYFVYQTLSESDNSDNDNNYGQIIAIVAYVLYIISQYIILWLSRTREYYADEYSITSTNNPNSLANALVKIGFGLSVNNNKEAINNQDKKEKKKKIHSVKDIGALGIFDSKTSKSLIIATNNNINDKLSIKNAMKWEMWNPWAFIYELRSTHPLISKRLLRISEFSSNYNQEPYIVFDLKPEENYVDDFFVELIIKFLPLFTVLLTIMICLIASANDNNIMLYIGLGGFLTVLFSYFKFKRSHKPGYRKTNVRELLGEVKVSDITTIPCEIEGKVIGKGDPGYFFSEDFILQDETGIIFLDYNQPLFILNKIFAIFKSHKYIDQNIKIKGWYRRSPVPYIEIYTMEIDGKVKKIFTYSLTIFGHILLFIVSFLIIIFSIM